MGRQWRKHDLVQSPFTVWIKSALITADLPWGMGLINRRQYIYLQIKNCTHHWARSSMVLLLFWWHVEWAAFSPWENINHTNLRCVNWPVNRTTGESEALVISCKQYWNIARPALTTTEVPLSKAPNPDCSSGATQWPTDLTVLV